MKYLLLFMILAIIIILIGCGNSKQLELNTIPAVDSKILKTYQNNHLVAKHIYENKIIRVYGLVTKSILLNDGKTRISLNNIRFIDSFSFRVKELVIDFTPNQIEKINQTYEEINLANLRRSANQTRYQRDHPASRFTKIENGIRVNDLIYVDGYLYKSIDNKTLILKPLGKYKLRNRHGIQRWDRRPEVFIGEIENL